MPAGLCCLLCLIFGNLGKSGVSLFARLSLLGSLRRGVGLLDAGTLGIFFGNLENFGVSLVARLSLLGSLGRGVGACWALLSAVLDFWKPREVWGFLVCPCWGRWGGGLVPVGLCWLVCLIFGTLGKGGTLGGTVVFFSGFPRTIVFFGP